MQISIQILYRYYTYNTLYYSKKQFSLIKNVQEFRIKVTEGSSWNVFRNLLFDRS